MRTLSRRQMAWVIESIKGGKRYGEIAKGVGISESRVSQIAKENGVNRNYMWTEEEDALLREHYWELGATGMVKFLPRHPNRQCISKHAVSLGLKTRVGPYGKLRGTDGKPPKADRN